MCYHGITHYRQCPRKHDKKELMNCGRDCKTLGPDVEVKIDLQCDWCIDDHIWLFVDDTDEDWKLDPEDVKWAKRFHRKMDSPPTPRLDATSFARKVSEHGIESDEEDLDDISDITLDGRSVNSVLYALEELTNDRGSTRADMPSWRAPASLQPNTTAVRSQAEASRRPLAPTRSSSRAGTAVGKEARGLAAPKSPSPVSPLSFVSSIPPVFHTSPVSPISPISPESPGSGEASWNDVLAGAGMTRRNHPMHHRKSASPQATQPSSRRVKIRDDLSVNSSQDSLTPGTPVTPVSGFYSVSNDRADTSEQLPVSRQRRVRWGVVEVIDDVSDEDNGLRPILKNGGDEYLDKDEYSQGLLVQVNNSSIADDESAANQANSSRKRGRPGLARKLSDRVARRLSRAKEGE